MIGVPAPAAPAPTWSRLVGGDPYVALLALAESELAAIRDARWDDLAELRGRQEALTAALPAMPPAAARTSLERLAGVRAEIRRELAAGLRDTSAELARLRRGRTAIRGYGAA